MEAYLRPLVSCRVPVSVICVRKKVFGKIEKNRKIQSKAVYVRVAYKSLVRVCVCVCVCVEYICVLLYLVVYVIVCVCVCVFVEYICVILCMVL